MGRHSPEDSVAATYYIETRGDLAEVARDLAVLETTGKWSGQAGPTERYEESRGEVLDVKATAPGKGFITLLYPISNMDIENSAFPCLWLSMIGGAIFALAAYDKSRLCDFSVPPAMMERFQGPGFGIAGTRELMGIGPDDLMIGTIIKPTAGLTPEEVAELAYNAAMGGMCFIKDDEKMMNPPYCPLGKRVRLVSEALRRAENETGTRVIYAPHITTTPDRILDAAFEAIGSGATALMLNFFAAGFSSLEILRRHDGIDVPIYAHCGGREALGRAAGQGLSPAVIVKMVRLLGGDYFRAGMYESYLVDSNDDIKAMHDASKSDWCPHKAILPAISGGLNAKTVGANVKALGRDALLLAGTGVFGHPGGPRAGVAALRSAAETALAER